MEALWLEDQQVRLRDDVPVPALQPDEALIRPLLAGICATDLALQRGYYPFSGVLGHEFVGRVVATEDPDWDGARVVGEINAAGCEPRCAACRAGRKTHCERRTVLGIVGRDGVFAERFCLPLRNLHRVPESLDDEAAVFVEPLAAALQIQHQVHVRPSDRVVVLGAGRLGQLIARTLALTGCALRVVGRPHQLQLLRAIGIDARAEPPTDGRADIVVDATGSPAGFGTARRLVRPGGTIVLKTTCAGETSMRLAEIVVDEVTVVGSRCGPFAPALRLLASGAVDPRPLISDRYPLARADQALAQAATAEALKVLIDLRRG